MLLHLIDVVKFQCVNWSYILSYSNNQGEKSNVVGSIIHVSKLLSLNFLYVKVQKTLLIF